MEYPTTAGIIPPLKALRTSLVVGGSGLSPLCLAFRIGGVRIPPVPVDTVVPARVLTALMVAWSRRCLGPLIVGACARCMEARVGVTLYAIGHSCVCSKVAFGDIASRLIFCAASTRDRARGLACSFVCFASCTIGAGRHRRSHFPSRDFPILVCVQILSVLPCCTGYTF